MKTSIAYKISPFIFFLLFIISTGMVIRQTGKDWTEKDAKKWVKSREWSNGLKLNVSSSVNAVEFAKQYHTNKEYWDKAFTFMRDKNLKDLAPGKYVIDGDNVYATVTEAPSKTFEQSAWESHRKYIDLQYVVTGQEKIGISPLAETTVTAPYDESKDIAHYTAKGKFYTATPDEFFLFFPNDAHRPNIVVDGYDVVKKLVIKIKYAN
ncbi:MAG TPA: YhcH/YjgK/YiaL family protein [Mucilaginibacter sp.]|jgi:YhcH/YjgK/YiaL family protein